VYYAVLCHEIGQHHIRDTALLTDNIDTRVINRVIIVAINIDFLSIRFQRCRPQVLQQFGHRQLSAHHMIQQDIRQTRDGQQLVQGDTQRIDQTHKRVISWRKYRKRTGTLQCARQSSDIERRNQNTERVIVVDGNIHHRAGSARIIHVGVVVIGVVRSCRSPPATRGQVTQPISRVRCNRSWILAGTIIQRMCCLVVILEFLQRRQSLVVLVEWRIGIGIGCGSGSIAITVCIVVVRDVGVGVSVSVWIAWSIGVGVAVWIVAVACWWCIIDVVVATVSCIASRRRGVSSTSSVSVASVSSVSSVFRVAISGLIGISLSDAVVVVGGGGGVGSCIGGGIGSGICVSVGVATVSLSVIVPTVSVCSGSSVAGTSSSGIGVSVVGVSTVSVPVPVCIDNGTSVVAVRVTSSSSRITSISNVTSITSISNVTSITSITSITNIVAIVTILSVVVVVVVVTLSSVAIGNSIVVAIRSSVARGIRRKRVAGARLLIDSAITIHRVRTLVVSVLLSVASAAAITNIAASSLTRVHDIAVVVVVVVRISLATGVSLSLSVVTVAGSGGGGGALSHIAIAIVGRSVGVGVLRLHRRLTGTVIATGDIVASLRNALIRANISTISTTSTIAAAIAVQSSVVDIDIGPPTKT